MSVPLRIEIMQRETIKPSSPTPLALRSLKLSLLDQFMPMTHIPLLLFYPRNGNDTDHLGKAKETSLLLRTSLSEVLTLFYPFAGRLRDNSSIECDDHGAEYIEARIHCIFSDILRKPENEVLKQLLPAVITARDGQLLVQASFFDCGGLVIGVNLSHKIADAATLTSFIKCWAATARSSSTEVIISPVFMGASIFPQMDLPIPMLPVDLIQGEAVLKRFVFEAPKITALREKAISASVPNPTRVESVTALIWKCAMSASTWLSPVFTVELKYVVCLIDTRDGDGIEAWISLSPEDMALFESNKELLEFSAAIPSVSV